MAHITTSQDNLNNLANNVRSCSDGIRARAEQVINVATHFDSRVASTLNEVSRFEAVTAGFAIAAGRGR